MQFKYEAINREGKTLKGQIEAMSETDAIRLLKQQDLTPIELAEAVAKQKIELFKGSRQASAQDRILGIRELGTLLAAGVPLAEAVDSLARAHAGSALGESASKIYAALRNGQPLSVCLRESGIEYKDFVYQLVAAGELTGRLAQSLHAAADQLEYEDKIKQEMRNALIYPSILVLSGIGATLLIFIVVVPKFANMLKNSRAQLPDISIWVLKTGLFVKTNLSWFGIGTLGVAMALFIAASNPAVRRGTLEGIAKLPLLGTWLTETEIGRWAAMLGTLLDNKVPIVRAMELAEAGVQLNSVQSKLQLAVRDLRAGKKLADALSLHNTVSPMGINLIRVGERSGELPAMLRTLAGLYNSASKDRMKRFLILLEPLTILIIGGVIGFIMVAIMLAITSLSNITL